MVWPNSSAGILGGGANTEGAVMPRKRVEGGGDGWRAGSKGVRSWGCCSHWYWLLPSSGDAGDGRLS